MSIPFAGETVTLVRRIEEKTGGKTSVSYETVILTGCSWRRTTHIVRSDNALISEEAIICRVPADQTKPAQGDLMILGAVALTAPFAARPGRSCTWTKTATCALPGWTRWAASAWRTRPSSTI